MASPSEIFADFEGLGDNCEFGFVGHHFGHDQSSLLRWAASRPGALIAALRERFSGLYEMQNLRPIWTTMVADARYDLHFHSKLISRDVDGALEFVHEPAERERIHAEEFEIIERRRARLLASLESARRIFVYKINSPLPEALVRDLVEAVAAYNSANALLLVEQGPDAGKVTCLSPNLTRATIDRLAPYPEADKASFDAWLNICERARVILGRAA